MVYRQPRLTGEATDTVGGSKSAWTYAHGESQVAVFLSGNGREDMGDGRSRSSDPAPGPTSASFSQPLHIEGARLHFDALPPCSPVGGIHHVDIHLFQPVANSIRPHEITSTPRCLPLRQQPLNLGLKR